MAFDEDEAPQARPRFTPLPIDHLGVAELERYIAELREEISRVEVEITRKQDFRNAADRFFKT